MMVNLSRRQLQQFVAAASHPSLSRAAEQCHVSQPAFSRALQALEVALGTRLFERSTRHLALTRDGERLLPRARRLLEDIDELARDAREPLGSELAGSVSLAVGTAFGSTVLPKALHAFCSRHPRVRVQVIDDNSRGITERVHDGVVDLGIGSLVGAGGALQGAPLLSAPLGVIAAPARHGLPARATLAQLRRLPLVKESEDTSIMSLLREAGSPWVGAMEDGVEASSLAIQLALVAQGLGVSIVSALGASHPMARGLLFVPLRPVLLRHMQLLHRKDRSQRPATAALAVAIQQAVMTAPLHAQVRRQRRPQRP
jgi:LysR family transcriptional regulator, carnitine catabolism transcriptional activator